MKNKSKQHRPTNNPRRAGAAQAAAPEKRRPGILLLAAFALTLIVSLPAIKGGFVDLDDRLYTTAAPASQGLTGEAVAFAFTSVSNMYWHPLTWISHEVDTSLFGASPAGHHLTSVVLHALTAAVLCLLFLRLGADLYYAGAAALLWSLHPLRVESFAWVAERKDVLCALFFVVSVAAYLEYVKRPSRLRYVLWVVCGVLALMSKPTAVSLPLVLLLLDYWPLRRPAQMSARILEKAPLGVLAIIVAALAAVGQRNVGATSLLSNLGIGTRLATASTSYIRYLGKVIWPLRLCCFYPYDLHPRIAWVIASTAALSAITVLVVLRRKRTPWLLVGWLWFVVTLLPNSGLIQAGRQSMADRFTHLPMIGLVLAAVWTAADWGATHPKRRRALAWAAGVALTILTFLTVRQIAYWHDSVALFEHAIATEDSAYARGNLAEAFMRDGRNADAEQQLQAALALAPDHFGYHNNLANVLLKLGNADQALREATIAKRLAPNNLSTTETMALVSLRKEDFDAAFRELDHAVQLGGDVTIIAKKMNDAGASLASRGRPREAERFISRAVSLSPMLVQARRNLVLVLLDEGRKDEARSRLRDAIQATGSRREYQEPAHELGIER